MCIRDRRLAFGQHLLRSRQHGFLLLGPPQLPGTQAGERADHQQRQRPAEQLAGWPAHALLPCDCDNAGTSPNKAAMNDSLKTLLVIAFLILILWNLGAGLYYLLVDKGQSKRTVNALTWRIGLSVLLFALVALGIFTGVIKPHGVGG